jgi:hypothetical protein
MQRSGERAPKAGAAFPGFLPDPDDLSNWLSGKVHWPKGLRLTGARVNRF